MANSTYAVTPVAVNAFLIGIATLALILRFLSRHLSEAGIWWDDWLALSAWPFTVTSCALLLIAGFHGFGVHGADPTFFLHMLYFAQLCYDVGTGLVKLSVLCFYYRLFAPSRRFTQILCVTGGFIIAWIIAFVIQRVFGCTPIESYWDSKVKGHCLPPYSVYMAQSISNLAFDFILLILPLKMLWKLKMRLVQKLALLVVFILGYLNPIISICRIVSFVHLFKKGPSDPTYNYVSPALWSTTEVAIAIFSCSIPSLTYLFRRAIDLSRGKNNDILVDNQNLARTNSYPEMSRGLESFSNTSDTLYGSVIEHSIIEKNAKSTLLADQIYVRRDVDVSVHESV